MDTTTKYYKTDTENGVAYISMTGTEHRPPEGSEEVSEDDYIAALDERDAFLKSRQEKLRNEKTALLKTAYDDLVAAGVSPLAAAAVSGYTPKEK